MSRRVTVRSEVPPFAMVPEWLLQAGVGAKPISANAIRVYAVLDRIAREKDETPPVSHAEIGRRSGWMSTATVKRAIAELEQVGAVDVRHQLDKLGKHPNSYLVRIRRREAQGSFLEPEAASEPDSSLVNHGQLTGDPSMDSSPMTRPQVTGELQEPERSSERREREREPAFDALALETGHDLKALSRSASRMIGVKLAEIVEAEQHRVSPEVTREQVAEQIRYRADRYRRLHPEWDLTPGSLAKHWATLGAKPVRIPPAAPRPAGATRVVTPEESERIGAATIADWRKSRRTSPERTGDAPPNEAGGLGEGPPAVGGEGS